MVLAVQMQTMDQAPSTGSALNGARRAPLRLHEASRLSAPAVRVLDEGVEKQRGDHAGPSLRKRCA